MSDKRRAVRHRVLKAGKVIFDARTVDCVVRDLSDSGAGILIEDLRGIPHEFALRIVSEHASRACHVIWRRQKRIGVAFY